MTAYRGSENVRVLRAGVARRRLGALALAVAPLMLSGGGAPAFAQQAPGLPLLPQPVDVVAQGKGFRIADGLARSAQT